MNKAFIQPIQKKAYKIIFENPFIEPVVVENEDQFKELIYKLKNEGKNQEAQELTEQWVNLKKEHFKINYKGKFINLGTKTVIMGVLNLTPDSFSNGDTNPYYKNVEKAVERIAKMLEEGADIIDIGGESTRPGATPVPVEEELERVLPVIKAARKELGDKFFISIDTYKSKVAQYAIEEGADIINDISGFTLDREMPSVVAKYDCPVIVNHIRGNPQTMQQGDIYYDDVVMDISKFLHKQISFAMEKGVRKDRFIIDPGIGFGKKVEHNVEIIKRLNEFKILGFPIMIGISRKSFLGIILKNLLNLEKMPSPKERLNATLGATAYAVLNGAHIVRTHDIKETVEFLTILDIIRGYKIV
ncbi:dihydropteroate synthase [Venenivibrio stagnispumantis]|uniref:Dihydropteroate synthase n=1 Tax=Venenivibrio stagnispumantis TaxID=407998 RepID=A0AA45WIE2_9AQUI|nr:dihydropteroate synthase [Venenivibrio stagnispumantis]MCW4572566.1 dihydropteroate synthase [Venenivibrio stagnispumantis]SMP00373.1 dihydropteroate synthase [Venenivibrio stagnispumantis]